MPHRIVNFRNLRVHCQPLCRGFLHTRARQQNAWRSRAVSLTKYSMILLSFPLIKVAHACYPLFHKHDDEELLLQAERRAPVRPETYTWLPKETALVLEATDRLIRDVVIAACVTAQYLRVIRSGEEDWSEAHQAGANLLLKLCQVNRGIYIKFGQHISQLEYLLPKEYVQTMKVMLNQAPEDTYDQICQVFREEFGCEPDSLFEWFDKRPIASASLAQVHTATLKSGEKVAVKIQHEGLVDTSSADIKTIQYLVSAAHHFFPKFNYQWLVDEIKHNLPRELDFKMEAANIERCRDNFAYHSQVHVPHVYPEFATSRILTMSFEEGHHIDQRDQLDANGIDRKEVAALVSSVFSEQIFVHGFVHCDPHAGNVLVRKSKTTGKTEIVLLDHGLYRELSEELRLNYCNLWRSIIFADESGIRTYSNRLGAGGMYQLFAAMLTTKSWDNIMDPSFDSLRLSGGDKEKNTTSGYVKQYQDEIQQILATIPRELLLLLKTNDCLRAIDLSLGSPVNTFVIMAKYCVYSVNRDKIVRDPSLWKWLSVLQDSLAVEFRIRAFQVAVLWSQWVSGSRSQQS